MTFSLKLDASLRSCAATLPSGANVQSQPQRVKVHAADIGEVGVPVAHMNNMRFPVREYDGDARGAQGLRVPR